MCVGGGHLCYTNTRLWRINSNGKKWSPEEERRGGRMGGVYRGGGGGEKRNDRVHLKGEALGDVLKAMLLGGEGSSGGQGTPLDAGGNQGRKRCWKRRPGVVGVVKLQWK